MKAAETIPPSYEAVKVAASERADEDLQQWWDRMHAAGEAYWLSNSDGPEVWRRLRITDRIRPGAWVLNIGVGLGGCTRALVQRGCHVHALDISDIALERVSDIARVWRPDELVRFPPGALDLAISHLVAQHMNDDDLLAQLEWVIRGLADDGVFAMQFLSSATWAAPPTREHTKAGRIQRSPDALVLMVGAAGGVVLDSFSADHGDDWSWHVVHIGRKPTQ